MINDLRVLGVVTARGGSKGLPGKNIRPLCGKPLIGWTIDVARASSILDTVIVSTDDAEIAALAEQFGAEVPFLRPPELAGDTASSIDVVIHAIDTLALDGRDFDLVVLLEPTSPLREPSDIDIGVQKMIDMRAEAVVSVCRAECTHPAFMFRQKDDSRMVPYLGEQPTGLRRQDIEPVYFLEGTLYASSIEMLKAKRSFYHEGTVAFEVPKWKSLEVDDVDDFCMIEALAKQRRLA
jgi:N-acylneuraminate cytidylyltransferase/CMP-N,N'-diacetyllegionaminic acid synthase